MAGPRTLSDVAGPRCFLLPSLASASLYVDVVLGQGFLTGARVAPGSCNLHTRELSHVDFTARHPWSCLGHMPAQGPVILSEQWSLLFCPRNMVSMQQEDGAGDGSPRGFGGPQMAKRRSSVRMGQSYRCPLRWHLPFSARVAFAQGCL